MGGADLPVESPEKAGYSSTGLAALAPYLNSIHSPAGLVLVGDKVIYAWGDLTYVAVACMAILACSTMKDGGDLGDAHPQPCTVAADCLARFTLPGSGYQLPYYGTFSIDDGNPEITQAVVFNQGLDRDAINDFSILVTAAQMANQLSRTLILTPHFESVVDADGGPCGGHVDNPEPNDLLWTCDAWSDGLASTNDPSATSYGALDALLTAVEHNFPQLERITVSGFSAGGQLTQRYAAVNAIDRGIHGVAFRYVVGSPSSYVYFDDKRPTNAGNCTTLGCPDGFAPYPDAAQCPGYNDWKYGTDDLEGAAARLTPVQLERAYVGRNVRYLFGALDDGPTAVADFSQLDVTCPALAQGPFPLQRGLAFYSYVTSELDAGQQQAQVVPGCGHSGSCVFQSNAGISAVFGK
jgi:hypothetical protein